MSRNYQEITSPYKEIIGDQVFSDYRKYLPQYSFPGRLKFLLSIKKGFRKASSIHQRAIREGRVFIGPFVGEFGNFLSYILPYICYLSEKGVEVHFCGTTVFGPFLRMDEGADMVNTYYPVRDFLGENELSVNKTEDLPEDVKQEVASFVEIARKDNAPFLDLTDSFHYWYVHRTFIVENRYMKVPDYSKLYGTGQENSVVVFPRMKGAKSTPNNGEPWDYQSLIEKLTGKFEKVYAMGHPAFSHDIQESRNGIVKMITADNSQILAKCANARLIISQHSGTVYLGTYTNTPVLVIFKGQLPIKGMNDTIIYNHYLGEKHKFAFAMSEEEILQYVDEKL